MISGFQGDENKRSRNKIYFSQTMNLTSNKDRLRIALSPDPITNSLGGRYNEDIDHTVVIKQNNYSDSSIKNNFFIKDKTQTLSTHSVFLECV